MILRKFEQWVVSKKKEGMQATTLRTPPMRGCNEQAAVGGPHMEDWQDRNPSSLLGDLPTYPPHSALKHSSTCSLQSQRGRLPGGEKGSRSCRLHVKPAPTTLDLMNAAEDDDSGAQKERSLENTLHNAAAGRALNILVEFESEFHLAEITKLALPCHSALLRQRAPTGMDPRMAGRSA